MSCILRAGGENFDVDAFCAGSAIVPDSVWRKGEMRFRNVSGSRTIHDSSGIRVVTSDAGFSALADQIADTILYFRRHTEDIKALAGFPGIDVAVLDFGAEISPPGWSSFSFPPELLSLAGYTGVSLCLSVYPCDEETEGDA